MRLTTVHFCRWLSPDFMNNRKPGFVYCLYAFVLDSVVIHALFQAAAICSCHQIPLYAHHIPSMHHCLHRRQQSMHSMHSLRGTSSNTDDYCCDSKITSLLSTSFWPVIRWSFCDHLLRWNSWFGLRTSSNCKRMHEVQSAHVRSICWYYSAFLTSYWRISSSITERKVRS